LPVSGSFLTTTHRLRHIRPFRATRSPSQVTYSIPSLPERISRCRSSSTRPAKPPSKKTLGPAVLLFSAQIPPSRIEGESAPSNLAADKNPGRGVSCTPPPSVSAPLTRTRSPKTRRIAGFSGRLTLCGESLCGSRLHGGGRSLERTRLSSRFPDTQWKYRRIRWVFKLR